MIMSYSRTTDTRPHGHTIPLDTIISYICITATQILSTQLFYILMTLLHRFTCIYALIVSVFLLHGYSCMPVTWLFFITDIDMIECWYAMWGTKCHVNLSLGVTFRISYLLFSVSRYLISWYQQSSCLLSYYMYHALLLFLIHCIINCTI